MAASFWSTLGEIGLLFNSTFGHTDWALLEEANRAAVKNQQDPGSDDRSID